jgi:hypothetical protein
MIEIPAKMTEPLALETLDFLRASVPEPVANHSIRTYLYAEFLVDRWDKRRDEAYDADAVFFAATLHDLGLGPEGTERPDRFEVAGADLAGEYLQKAGIAQGTVDRVWDAIALHTSIGIAQRKGLVSHLLVVSTGMDFGADSESVTDEMAADLHARFPRHGASAALGAAIVDQARVNAAKAPLASLAHYLVRTSHLGPDPAMAARWES